MRYLFIILLVGFVTSCGSMADINGYQPYTVKKVEVNGELVEEYLIKFHGTELTTADEARDAWNFRAKNVCRSDYQFLTYKQFEQYNEQQKDFLNSVRKCPVNNNLSCIESRKGYGDGFAKKRQIVEGFAICIL